MKHIKGAIFDLDGTLLDSMDVWQNIDIDFLAKRGFSVPEDYIAEVSSKSFKQAAEYTIRRFGLEEDPEDIMEEWFQMSIDAYRFRVRLKPYVFEYISFLKGNGIKTAVATASDERLFIPALQNNEIYHLFDAFTTVKEVQRGKGFPDVYFAAAGKLGLEASECAVFEDIYAGVKGAKDGGFYTVGVYDSYSEVEADKIKALSDRYITNFGQLIFE